MGLRWYAVHPVAPKRSATTSNGNRILRTISDLSPSSSPIQLGRGSNDRESDQIRRGAIAGVERDSKSKRFSLLAKH